MWIQHWYQMQDNYFQSLLTNVFGTEYFWVVRKNCLELKSKQSNKVKLNCITNPKMSSKFKNQSKILVETAILSLFFLFIDVTNTND
jgi:hypothetical protein